MTRIRSRIARTLLSSLTAVGLASVALSAQTPADLRPMTFLDAQLMKRAGSPTPSPDGAWLLHTVTTPDWQEADQQSDLYLVSLVDGVSSMRQMTFTREKNETSPNSPDATTLGTELSPRWKVRLHSSTESSSAISSG